MVWKSCSKVYFLRDLWVQHHVFASFVPSVLFVNCMQCNSFYATWLCLAWEYFLYHCHHLNGPDGSQKAKHLRHQGPSDSWILFDIQTAGSYFLFLHGLSTLRHPPFDTIHTNSNLSDQLQSLRDFGILLFFVSLGIAIQGLLETSNTKT